MVLTSKTHWRLVDESVSKGHMKKIIMDGKEIGSVHYQSLRSLTTSVLEDLDDDEAEVMFPLFKNYQMQNGYYIHEINIKPANQHKGIGTEVMTFLKKTINAPILLYSLADAECFWEKIGFHNLESYYYSWEPQ